MPNKHKFLTVPILESDLKTIQDYVNTQLETIDITIYPDDISVVKSIRQALLNLFAVISDEGKQTKM